MDAAWCGAVRDRATALRADPKLTPLPPSLDAVALRDAESPEAFDRRFLELVRIKSHVDTLDFDIPHRAGWKGAWMQRVRKGLWVLLRYQHDRMFARQNRINAMLSSALELERAARVSEGVALRRRIEDLEQRG
jgi:hypothetical protein